MKAIFHLQVINIKLWIAQTKGPIFRQFVTSYFCWIWNTLVTGIFCYIQSVADGSFLCVCGIFATLLSAKMISYSLCNPIARPIKQMWSSSLYGFQDKLQTIFYILEIFYIIKNIWERFVSVYVWYQWLK